MPAIGRSFVLCFLPMLTIALLGLAAPACGRSDLDDELLVDGAVRDASADAFEAGDSNGDSNTADAIEELDSNLPDGTICNSESCSGCCEGNHCLGGNADMACGVSGQSCRSCTALDETCHRGSLRRHLDACNAQSCSGCCGQDGTCHTGKRNTACGGGGEACRRTVRRIDETCAAATARASPRRHARRRPAMAAATATAPASRGRR